VFQPNGSLPVAPHRHAGARKDVHSRRGGQRRVG
jgi:hypothetical protein